MASAGEYEAALGRSRTLSPPNRETPRALSLPGQLVQPEYPTRAEQEYRWVGFMQQVEQSRKWEESNYDGRGATPRYHDDSSHVRLKRTPINLIWWIVKLQSIPGSPSSIWPDTNIHTFVYISRTLAPSELWNVSMRLATIFPHLSAPLWISIMSRSSFASHTV